MQLKKIKNPLMSMDFFSTDNFSDMSFGGVPMKDYIKNSNYLEYDILGELLAIPGILSEKGIMYFILEKYFHHNLQFLSLYFFFSRFCLIFLMFL